MKDTASLEQKLKITYFSTMGGRMVILDDQSVKLIMSFVEEEFSKKTKGDES